MSEEDKPEGLTPADLRKKRRAGALVFILFLVAVMAGLIATVLSVNDGRNYRRLVERFGLQKYLLKEPRDTVHISKPRSSVPGAHFPPWLLRAGLERFATFEAPETRSAEERCTSLKTKRAKEATFTVNRDGWECLYFQEFGSASEPASLFVQARGGLPDTVRNFRIKLSLIDPVVDQSVIDEAVAALERFGLPMTAETRAYLKNMISTRREFSSIVENYRMTFSKEITDERRYNLLILPRPQTIACGEAPETPLDSATTPLYRMPVSCLALRALPPRSSS